MGATNQFQWAVDFVAKELHFTIAGEARSFRDALDRAGQRRFEHCVWLVKNWARPHHKGAAKYDRLMRLLALVTPEKTPGAKYRNPETEAGLAANAELDREFVARVAREP